METYYFLLGNHPLISQKEIEGVFRLLGIEATTSLSGPLLTVQSPSALPATILKRIGGTDRILRHIASIQHFPAPQDILDAITSLAGSTLPPKWKLGLSIHGASHNINLQRLGIDVKKAARAQNSKVAFVTPKGSSRHLNTAQVLFNSLMKSPHAELWLIEQGSSWTIAKTEQIQDIEAYEKRDTSRPVRDAKAGMLPPKLAQMMINIAVGAAGNGQDIAILDPFCGAGTILQEGWLMGYQTIGSDADEKMLAACERNLHWLATNFKINDQIPPQLRTHDVQHSFPPEWEGSISAVVTEAYLGKARSTPLSRTVAHRDITRLADLYLQFFKNIYSVLKENGTILAALPQLKTPEGFVPLPLEFIDEITGIGYRQIQLSSNPRGSLIYKRPDAVVARELLLFSKTS